MTSTFCKILLKPSASVNMFNYSFCRSCSEELNKVDRPKFSEPNSGGTPYPLSSHN
jgi:hypothetical protein